MRAKALSRMALGWRRITSSMAAGFDLRVATGMPKPGDAEGAGANPQAEGQERGAEEQGAPPAPAQELLARHLAQGQHGEIGEEQAARHAELRPGGDESARMVG